MSMLRVQALLLVAALGLLLFVFRAPPPWQQDVGTPGDERFLQDWYPREVGGQVTFRWSRPGSKLILHGAPSPARLLLVLDAGLAPARVRLMAEGQTLATLEVAAHRWRSYVVPLEAWPTLWSLVRAPTLEIVCDQYPLADDGRRVGIKLSEARLEPDPSRAPWTLPLGRAAVLACTLAVLAGVLGRRGSSERGGGAPHPPEAPPPLRGSESGSPASWVALSLVALAALLLAFQARRNPYWLAWAFPFMPVTLTLLFASLWVRPRRHETDEASWPFGREPLAAGGTRSALLLALVLLLAFGVRFYRIGDLPWAMWQDEARHGLVALRILEDSHYRPIYVPSVQLPALGLYPFALALRLWDIHPWSLRSVTALAGTLSVLPLYALARRLTRSSEIALLAAAFLAVSSWHVSISRLSFPVVFDPLLALTGLWMLLRGLAGTAPLHNFWLAGAGLCFGMALQTYHTGRVTPFVGALLAYLAGKHTVGRARTALVVAGLVFSLCAAPLFAFARAHPDHFNRRVSEVFLLSHAERNGIAPLTALDASVGRHLLMFNVRGDDNGRHHAPGWPLLDVVTGLGFLAGIGLLVGRWDRWESRFLLGALALGTLPSVLAVDGPHAMRSIGAAGFACLVAGIGWVDISRRASLPRAALVAPLALALGLNSWTYFVAMPTDARVWQSFYPVQTQIGLFVRGLAERRHQTRLDDVYVSQEVAGNDVFTYLAHGLALSTFTGSVLSRPASRGALFVLSGPKEREHAQALAAYLGPEPAPTLLGPPFPGLATPSFAVYELRGLEPQDH